MVIDDNLDKKYYFVNWLFEIKDCIYLSTLNKPKICRINSHTNVFHNQVYPDAIERDTKEEGNATKILLLKKLLEISIVHLNLKNLGCLPFGQKIRKFRFEIKSSGNFPEILCRNCGITLEVLHNFRTEFSSGKFLTIWINFRFHPF